MQRPSTRHAVVVATVGVLSTAAGGRALAQSPPAAPAGDTLTQLLQEVRLLRQTVEQTARVNVRVQITLQRLSLQDQQVRALTDQAGQLESGTASTTQELERERAELGEVEEQLAQETDPNARRGLVEQRTSLREAIERDTAQEHDLRRRTVEVNQSLVLEKGRLDELNRALDALERTLESPAHRSPGPG